MNGRQIERAFVLALLVVLGVSATVGYVSIQSKVTRLRGELSAAAAKILEQQGYIDTLEERPEEAPEPVPGADTVFSGGGRIEPQVEIRYRTQFVKSDCPVPQVEPAMVPDPIMDCACQQWELQPENLGLDWRIDVQRPTASETAKARFWGEILAQSPLGVVRRPFDAQEALGWSYAPPPACPQPRRYGWTVGVGAGWVPGEGGRAYAGAMWGRRMGR